MRTAFRLVCAVALLATVGAPIAYLGGAIELAAMQRTMVLATVGWFALAPFAISAAPRGRAVDRDAA